MTTPNPGAWRHPSAPTYTNAHQVAADLRGYGVRAQVRVVGVTRTYGVLLTTRIKGNASGRPGPRYITGDYRRSWHEEFWQRGGEIGSRSFTNAPQSRRLEYGFVGPDRLGRVYNQPPYPHVAPAVAQTEPEFLAALAAAVRP